MLIEVTPWTVALSTTILALLGYCAVSAWRYLSRGDQAVTVKPSQGPDPSWCLRFARRAERPMSIIRITLPYTARSKEPADALSGLERLPAEIKSNLRCSDLVTIADPNGTAVEIYCLDTDKRGAAELAERLRHHLAAGHSIERIAFATFPEDGYSLAELEQVTRRAASHGARHGFQDRSHATAGQPRTILDSAE